VPENTQHNQSPPDIGSFPGTHNEVIAGAGEEK